MADRRRGSRSFQRSPRRATNWTLGFLNGWQSVAVDGSAAHLILDPEAAEVQNGTLIRVRGTIRVATSSAAGVNGSAYFGIAVVEQRAFDAGIAVNALPRPKSEGGDDIWLWHSSIGIRGSATAETAIPANGIIQIDSKSMRKYEDNSIVALISESSVAVILYTYSIRILSKFA